MARGSGLVSSARERFVELYGIAPDNSNVDPRRLKQIEDQIIREQSHKPKWQQQVSSQLQSEHIEAKWQSLDEVGKLTEEYIGEIFKLYLA